MKEKLGLKKLCVLLALSDGPQTAAEISEQLQEAAIWATPCCLKRLEIMLGHLQHIGWVGLDTKQRYFLADREREKLRRDPGLVYLVRQHAALGSPRPREASAS